MNNAGNVSEFKGIQNILRFQAGPVHIELKADNLIDQKNFTLDFIVSFKPLCSK